MSTVAAVRKNFKKIKTPIEYLRFAEGACGPFDIKGETLAMWRPQGNIAVGLVGEKKLFHAAVLATSHQLIHTCQGMAGFTKGGKPELALFLQEVGVVLRGRDAR